MLVRQLFFPFISVSHISDPFYLLPSHLLPLACFFMSLICLFEKLLWWGYCFTSWEFETQFEVESPFGGQELTYKSLPNTSS